MFTNLTNVEGKEYVNGCCINWLVSVMTCDGYVEVVAGVITARTISRTSTMTACHAQLALHTRILSSPHQSAAVYSLSEHFTRHATLPG